MLYPAIEQQMSLCSGHLLCIRHSSSLNTGCQPPRVQAMMELGATVCTQAPKCAECPVRAHCGAYAEVQQHIGSGGSAASAPPVTRFPTKVQALEPCGRL
jgi:adenine-specific DNA glycosylase